MLRRRRPPSAVGEDKDPKKGLAKSRRTSLKEIRTLLEILAAAVWDAVNPSSDVRDQEYSQYLTRKVKGLTIGWHIFRTITEGAFLMTYGLAFNTIVVQLFWTMSASSLLLYSTSRSTWLHMREAMCVWTNITYGAVTVLKIVNLVPRLPNENNYMFKHCFLTMADAAFSQTPVHKQYVVQFAEALIRVIVWHRYNVLLDMSTPGVVAVSLAWQLWLVTFSAILQARHVSAFQVERAAAAAAAAAAGTRGDATAAATTATATGTEIAPYASVLLSTRRSGEQAPAPAGEIAAALSCVEALPALVAAAAEEEGPPDGGGGGGDGQEQESTKEGTGALPTAAGGAAGQGPVKTVQQQQESWPPLSSAQSRYLRALRSVARGPSSYVLLAHQRRQSGGPHCATAQFYISSASPDMLPSNWRDKLAAAIAEGAPGWQLANVCVRKGSLIVHLDLVYCGAPQQGMEPNQAAAGQSLWGPAADDVLAVAAGVEAGPIVGVGEAVMTGSVWPNYMGGPAGNVEQQAGKQLLDDFVGGMSAEALLKLLGLPPDTPAGPAHPVAVQLETTDADAAITAPAAAAAANDVTTGFSFLRQRDEDSDLPLPSCTASDTDTEAAPLPAAAAAPPTTSLTPPLTPPHDVTSLTASSAPFSMPSSNPPPLAAALASPITSRTPHPLTPLLASLNTALHPPPELSSRAYTAFLSTRVGWLHTAYAACLLTACASGVVVQTGTRGRGVNPLTLVLFLSAELLSLGAHAVMSAEGWSAWRAVLVYVGVGLRTLQMAACTCGFLPHVLKDSDCISGRWVKKVVLITTLQALCMQPPVRSFFLVRIPSLALCIYVHVVVCETAAPLLGAVVQHVCWEACLFAMSAWLQHRHLEAFHHANQPHHFISKDGTTTTTTRPSIPEPCPAVRGGGGSCPWAPSERPEEPGQSHDRGTTELITPSVADDTASTVLAASGVVTPCDVSQSPSSELPPDSLGQDGSAISGHQAAANSVATAPASALLAPAAASPFSAAAAPLANPTDVIVSSPVVAMAPRRAASLQLSFSCAPAVVDDLQVVLRHINPASMSSGVHNAHAVRDITHALAAPFGAAAAPPHLPAPFTIDLTLVAAPADMPGLVHVELWRGRRRLISHPVLLASITSPSSTAASAAPAIARADVNILIACAARASAGGATAAGAAPAAASGGSWLDDVRCYVENLRHQGHESAADQFLEELGGWLAQAAALERGLISTGRGGSTTAGTIANVLYFHGYGSNFMYVKPRRVSRGGVSGGAGGGAAASGPGSAAARTSSAGEAGGRSSLEAGVDSLQGTLRQLLLCQGSMLLAVAVEAAAVSLSSYLAGLMVGQLGARLAGMLEGARTPVTQLPLLHAAVKSGSEKMVDLVAEWCTSCGVKDLWGQEAAVMAVALEAAGPGGQGSRASGNNLHLSSTSPLLPTASGAGSGQPRSSRSLLYEKLYDRSYGSGGNGSGAGESPFRLPEPPQRSASGSGGIISTARNASRSQESKRSSVHHDVMMNPPDSAADPLLSSIPGLPHDVLLTTALTTEAHQPFKILNFRVSHRSGAASTGPRPCAHVASHQDIHQHAEWPFRNGVARGGGGMGSSLSCRSMCLGAAGGGGDGGAATQHSVGRSSEAGLSSLDLVGDAVLVLTPLHLALALGDGGELAAHILRTYPEAFEWWRAHQGPQEVAEAAASALGPSCSDMSRGSHTPCRQSDEPVAADAATTTAAAASDVVSCASSHPNSGPTGANPHKPLLGQVFASMPGLGGRARSGSKPQQLLAAALGAPGHPDTDPRDSLEADSLQSMSLSEVAFLEGIRWVDEAPARRAGIKVTRM